MYLQNTQHFTIFHTQNLSHTVTAWELYKGFLPFTKCCTVYMYIRMLELSKRCCGHVKFLCSVPVLSQGSNLTFFARCQPGIEVQKFWCPVQNLSACIYKRLKPYFFFRRQSGTKVLKTRCPEENLVTSGTRYFEPC